MHSAVYSRSLMYPFHPHLTSSSFSSSPLRKACHRHGSLLQKGNESTINALTLRCPAPHDSRSVGHHRAVAARPIQHRIPINPIIHTYIVFTPTETFSVYLASPAVTIPPLYVNSCTHREYRETDTVDCKDIYVEWWTFSPFEVEVYLACHPTLLSQNSLFVPHTSQYFHKFFFFFSKG